MRGVLELVKLSSCITLSAWIDSARTNEEINQAMARIRLRS
jgi:hypothetical protein